MLKFKQLLLLGVGLEIIIFLVSYSVSSGLAETFRYAARFSGRLSLIIFLLAIWQFSRSNNSSEEELSQTYSITAVFAILHYIHLFLLMTNIELNGLTLIPHKLAGGALAYLMILLYPIFFDRIKYKKTIHTIYFLYVGFVMAMTYIARMGGEFEGAPPEVFHKLGLGLVIAAMLYFIYRKFFKITSK